MHDVTYKSDCLVTLKKNVYSFSEIDDKQLDEYASLEYECHIQVLLCAVSVSEIRNSNNSVCWFHEGS
jgi:hypothetical protein